MDLNYFFVAGNCEYIQSVGDGTTIALCTSYSDIGRYPRAIQPISKKFSDNYHEIQIIYWGSLAGVAVAFVGLLLFGEAWPTFALTPAWGWLFIYALVQVATVWLLVYGFKNLEAQVGSVILPVEIIFATIFGYLIFGETLTMGTLLGGLLIASAAFLPNITMLVEQRRMKNRSV